MYANNTFVYAKTPGDLTTMSTYYKYFTSAIMKQDYKQANLYGNQIGKIYQLTKVTNPVDLANMKTLQNAVNNMYKTNPLLQQSQYTN